MDNNIHDRLNLPALQTDNQEWDFLNVGRDVNDLRGSGEMKTFSVIYNVMTLGLCWDRHGMALTQCLPIPIPSIYQTKVLRTGCHLYNTLAGPPNTNSAAIFPNHRA